MAVEAEKYREILEKIVGKTLTVINPECYKAHRLGYRIEADFYKGKILEVKEDHVILSFRFAKDPKKEEMVPVTQYVPIERIKRVSILPDEILFHL